MFGRARGRHRFPGVSGPSVFLVGTPYTLSGSLSQSSASSFIPFYPPSTVDLEVSAI
jgi:hypothetical protein